MFILLCGINRLSLSSNGWTDDFLCAEWFEKCFIPTALSRRKAEDESILLIYDGHGSHLSPQMIELAMANNVILYCLPAHTTHRSQVLDVCGFGPLQHKWQDACQNYIYKHGVPVTKSDIVQVYMDARKDCFKPDTILTGWRLVGIRPLNPDIFTADDYAPSINTSTIAYVPECFPEINPEDPSISAELANIPDFHKHCHGIFVHKTMDDYRDSNSSSSGDDESDTDVDMDLDSTPQRNNWMPTVRDDWNIDESSLNLEPLLPANGICIHGLPLPSVIFPEYAAHTVPATPLPSSILADNALRSPNSSSLYPSSLGPSLGALVCDNSLQAVCLSRSATLSGDCSQAIFTPSSLAKLDLVSSRLPSTSSTSVEIKKLQAKNAELQSTVAQLSAHLFMAKDQINTIQSYLNHKTKRSEEHIKKFTPLGRVLTSQEALEEARATKAWKAAIQREKESRKQASNERAARDLY
jgi:hypothetical protein